jgi:ABC-2 type transport system permease protein
MRDALRAEWVKLRTLASTQWLLLGSVALSVGAGAAVLVSAGHPAGGHEDVTRLSLTGIDVGQVAVVVLAVASIGDEYSTGLIGVTLTAVPRRLSVLGAKALSLTGLVAITGVLAVGGSLLAGALIPSEAAPAGDGTTLRAAAGTVLYLVLIALISLGISTAVRDTATATGTVLGLLYLFPFLAQFVSASPWHRLLERAGPMTAGLAIQATVDTRSLPIGPWAGLGVLAAWAGGALATGAVLFRVRDA